MIRLNSRMSWPSPVGWSTDIALWVRGAMWTRETYLDYVDRMARSIGRARKRLKLARKAMGYFRKRQVAAARRVASANLKALRRIASRD